MSTISRGGTELAAHESTPAPTRLSRAATPAEEVCERLAVVLAAGQPIIGAGAGTGLSAKSAVNGGADLILVYNSGRFRMAGIGSNAGTLPLGDANAMMMEMGLREILPAVIDTPVVAGVNGTDPTRDMRRLVGQVLEAGFSGAINFPTMGIIDGRWRQSLEETGFSYRLEVSMLSMARAVGLFTMAYTFTEAETREMSAAGVHVIVTHLGTTVGGTVGADPANTPSLDAAIERTGELIAVARAENPNVLVLTHGGPIATPEDVRVVLANTSAQGFVGASTMERLPVETAIRDTVREFKSVPLGASDARP
ncbi:MAG: phosphoenolpyruvate hydrolase family protein [Actinomycetota bacterium]|nr:phosphoenolpyruvate hydrolase family protein [Actinomycetota bacterium]